MITSTLRYDLRETNGLHILAADPPCGARIVEVFGDIATADHTAVMVPGNGHHQGNYFGRRGRSGRATGDRHCCARCRRSNPPPASRLWCGTGKTTAVRILSTLLRFDFGHVRVAGRDVSRDPSGVRDRIGVAGQYAAINEILIGRASQISLVDRGQIIAGGAVRLWSGGLGRVEGEWAGQSHFGLANLTSLKRTGRSDKFGRMETAPNGTPASKHLRLGVDIWTDVVCPHCYIGDTLFVQALERFEQSDRVDVRYRSFLLLPQPPSVPVPLNHFIAQQMGISLDDAAKVNDPVTTRGRALGLDYRFDRALVVDARPAHRLHHFAASRGKQHGMLRRLFRAYFTEGHDISDHETLARLAVEAGLSAGQALMSLQSGEFASEVEADLLEARRLGVTGVPFYVFGNRYAVPGAQEVDGFLRALETAWRTTVEGRE
ncbi:DsbA family protein [Nocardioides sp. NPDC087217]|uniref:DsbA family protein n=1 Tax=Nocardioides sp. NPDC087217 TaxID=3364335 RepID=UPI0038104E60